MNRRRPLVLALASVAALGLAACSTPSESGDLQAFSIEGGWTLVSGEGPNGEVTPVEGSPITLDVDGKGAVSGKGGCNNYHGEATVEGEKVTFGPLGMTMMMCDEAVMTAEYAYSTAMEGVTEGSISDDQLVLTGEGVELRFDPA